MALSIFSVYGKISLCKKLRTSTIHWVDSEKNVSQTDRQTDRWTDEQNWFYRTPSAKIDVWSCFSEIWEKNFLKLFGWIVSHMETIQNKCQRYRVDWRSNQKPFHHYQCTKIVQSIYSIYQIICEVHLI